MKTHAPVALFIFNRPAHLMRTLESLRVCRDFADSPIFVFADGPGCEADEKAVSAARSIAKSVLGERATYRFATENRGLADSVIAGVTELTEDFGRAIVVEDDLNVSRNFLSYMNMALDRYADDEHIMQVSGHMFAVPEFQELDEALFFPLTTTWGWGTWHRAWKYFDSAATGWEELLTDTILRRQFNMDGSYNFTDTLKKQMLGNVDSWGIRWYWSVFRRQGLVVFPPQTLVQNIGMDGTGTHGAGVLKRFRGSMHTMRRRPVQFPARSDVDAVRWAQLKKTVWRLNGGWSGEIMSGLRAFLSSFALLHRR